MTLAQDRLLDLRTFQDIVDEARRLIPRYCPEWTDHNLSDPGITLIELFAWMTEAILYQVNRVPDEMYIRFLDLVGVQCEPPRPALVGARDRAQAVDEHARTSRRQRSHELGDRPLAEEPIDQHGFTLFRC